MQRWEELLLPELLYKSGTSAGCYVEGIDTISKLIMLSSYGLDADNSQFTIRHRLYVYLTVFLQTFHCRRGRAYLFTHVYGPHPFFVDMREESATSLT